MQLLDENLVKSNNLFVISGAQFQCIPSFQIEAFKCEFSHFESMPVNEGKCSVFRNLEL